MNGVIQRERKLGWEREIVELNQKLDSMNVENEEYRLSILNELKEAHLNLIKVIELEIELSK